MAKLNKLFIITLTSAFIAGTAMFTGCGGGISQEQWQELQDLDAQIKQLESDKSNKEAQRDKLKKEIADKDAKIKSMAKDIETIKNCK
jgi:septal ring factor EnvC (AmiA/AmiB activator)